MNKNEKMNEVKKRYLNDVMKCVEKGYKFKDFMVNDSSYKLLNNLEKLKDIDEESQRFVMKVNFALLSLEKDEAMIIYNDYLLKKEPKWWVPYFSKASYYRKRNKAIEVFLDFLEL